MSEGKESRKSFDDMEIEMEMDDSMDFDRGMN
jgi:hypothetical protein